MSTVPSGHWDRGRHGGLGGEAWRPLRTWAVHGMLAEGTCEGPRLCPDMRADTEGEGGAWTEPSGWWGWEGGPSRTGKALSDPSPRRGWKGRVVAGAST